MRFHGRGGQGVVTAAELLASAAFSEDRSEPVAEPDALLIQDPTLLHQSDLFAGLTADGYPTR